MNSFGLFKNILLATSLTTMLVMVPLNSVILAHPQKLVCLSCLISIYTGAIVLITFLLCLTQRAWGGKLYGAILKVLTLSALIGFLHAVQLTTVPSAWRTYYVVLCGVALAPLVFAFVRRNTEVPTLLLQFALILTLYEGVNLVRIIRQAITLPPRVNMPIEASSQPGPLTSGPHVFLVVLDELSLIEVMRNELLDRAIVPNLAQFSRTATWYRQAETLYAGTVDAIPSILTGRKDVGDFVQEFIVRQPKCDMFNLAAKTHTLYLSGTYLPYCEAFFGIYDFCRVYIELQFSSYSLLFSEWWGRAVPGELKHTVAGQLLRDWIAGVLDPYVDKWDYNNNKAGSIKFGLPLERDSRRPVFGYIHSGLPHKPYIFRMDGSQRPDALTKDFSEMNQTELLRAHEHYREQIYFTDQLIGSFFSKLKHLNMYDEALIIVTSDHGVSFNPSHPGRQQRRLDVKAVARIPLLVKLPTQRAGKIDDSHILLPDIFRIVSSTICQIPRSSDENAIDVCSCQSGRPPADS